MNIEEQSPRVFARSEERQFPKKVKKENTLITPNWQFDFKTLEALENDDTLSPEEMAFWETQLEQNKFLQEFVEDWDDKVKNIIETQPAIKKYGLKQMINHSL